MLHKLIFLLLSFTLPTMVFACEIFSIDMKVQPADSFSINNQSFDIEITVLLDDSCTFTSQNHRFYVWTYYGEKHAGIAQIQSSRTVDPSELGCVSASQLSDTSLTEFTLKGAFSLMNSKNPHILVYFEYGTQQYLNIAGSDTTAVPVSAWVDLFGQFVDTNYYPTPYITNPHLKDPNSSFLTGCIGKPKSFSPFTLDPDKDSLGFEVSKFTWFDTTSATLPTPIRRDFSGYYGRFYPIPVDSFAIRKYRSLNFIPTASGFYALPIAVKELRPEDIGFAAWYTLSTTYRQVPVFFNDQCTPSISEAFKQDTLAIDCSQSKIHLPLEGLASSNSISPDGSDLKFHNANGYPALITAARAKDKHASYTDSLELDIRFLYDGYYEVQLLQGADGNRLIDDCGYEMSGNYRITLLVQNCGQVGLAEEKTSPISVYPNPATSQINITSGHTEISNITIFNLLGQPVLESEKQGREISLALPNPLNGLYILRIKLSDGKFFHQRVKIEN